MLHTIMPIEFVYGETRNEDSVVDYVYRGVLMEVKPLKSGQAMIVRLINPPLDYYLNDQYMPGSLIPFTYERSDITFM